MVEIPAFVRRRSSRKFADDQLPSPPAETTETAIARTNSTAQRLTKHRQPDSSTTSRSDSTTRSNRNSLVDVTRKSFDRRYLRSSTALPDAASHQVDQKLELTSAVEHPLIADTFTAAKNDSMKPKSQDQATKTSTANDNSYVERLICDDGFDLDAAIQLLQRLKKKATSEELTALHNALSTDEFSHASDRANGGMPSPYSRRSSMCTPGLAGRSSSRGRQSKKSEDFSLPSPPQLFHRPRPLSTQLVAPKATRVGCLLHQSSCVDLLRPHNGVPNHSRSDSPADIDISSIGALELGTLRITNGAVSPEPGLVSEADVASTSPATTSPARTANLRPKSEPHAPSASPLRTVVQSDVSITPRSYLDNDVDCKQTPTIPGLDAYNDSSDEDEQTVLPKQAASSFSGDEAYSTQKPCKATLRSASITSRLSPIEDNETVNDCAKSPFSVQEPTQSPYSSFLPCDGHNVQLSPPSASSSDRYSIFPATAQRLSPLRSNPRPYPSKKPDSGYNSEVSSAERISSDDDSTFMSVSPAAKSYESVIATLPRLETIPSVSDIFSLITHDNASEHEVTVDRAGGHNSTLAAEEQPCMDRSTVPNPQRNLGFSMSLPSFTLEGDRKQAKSPGKLLGSKPRKKLYKPPPLKRGSTVEAVEIPSSPAVYPTVPDELSINFSRRMSRAAGGNNVERTSASLSCEKLSEQESPKPLTTLESDLSITSEKFTPTKLPPASTDSNDASPKVAKKKSRFSFRGRSRSKSRGRPECTLPREQDTPTLADTVPQYADIVKAEAIIVTEQVLDENTDNPPPPTSESKPLPSAAQNVKNKRWSHQLPLVSSFMSNDHKRPESVPNAANLAVDTQCPSGEGDIRKDESPMRQRSESVTASVYHAVPGDDDAGLTPAPKTPSKSQTNATIAKSAESEAPQHPVLGTSDPEQRTPKQRVPARGKSFDSPSESNICLNERSPQLPDVMNTAYTTSRYSSPAPDGYQLSYSQPRIIPWEMWTSPGIPTIRRTDSAVFQASSHKYSDQASPKTNPTLTIISSNIRTASEQDDNTTNTNARDTNENKPLVKELAKRFTTEPQPMARKPVLQTPPPRQHRSSASRERARHATASPESLYDRYAGGLDYGRERGSGFSGSAGTRTGASDKAHRKSMVTSEYHGVDLSDVPLFIKRVENDKRVVTGFGG